MSVYLITMLFMWYIHKPSSPILHRNSKPNSSTFADPKTTTRNVLRTPLNQSTRYLTVPVHLYVIILGWHLVDPGKCGFYKLCQNPRPRIDVYCQYLLYAYFANLHFSNMCAWPSCPWISKHSCLVSVAFSYAPLNVFASWHIQKHLNCPY